MKVVRLFLGSRAVRMLPLAAVPFVLARLPGCAATPPSTQPSSFSDRQDAAMKDPFNYQPAFGGNNNLGNYDSNGMKKDMNDVLNP